MQVLQDNFFYHSNPRLGADGDLENERQLLAEEQKLCKAQARKFSSETNRRRKALDERRRRWDVQEQQLRENILQQRRQQVQDATERFQRAHLPPSERRRQPFRTKAPNLDDALNQIQCTSSPYTRQNSSFTSNTNISRSCTPSPKPPTVAKSSHRQALSAVEAYSKLLQEQSRAEAQQDPSPQGSHLSDCCNSESLSSKDSLENEDVGHRDPRSSFSSFYLDLQKTQPDPRKHSDPYPPSDLTSFSGMLLLGDGSAQSRKLFEPKLRKQEDSQWPPDKMRDPEASWGFNAVRKPPKTDTRPALGNCNILALCEIMSGDPEHCEINSPRNSPKDNSNVTDRDTATNAAFESCVPREVSLEQKSPDVRLLKYPSATETPKSGNSKDILFETPSKPNILLNNSTTDNLLKEETPHQDKHLLSSQREPSASMNNLNKVSNSQAKCEKTLNTGPPSHACLLHLQSHKCHQSPEGEVPKRAASEAASRPACEVRLVKGILKKQSKYMSGDAAYAFGPGHLVFAKQVALAIRDSVELTREKSTDAGGGSAVKKKLRWFDEVEREARENATKHARGGKASKASAEDHQLCLSAASGAPRAGPGGTPAAAAAAAGYHFTREAWADVGVQVSLLQERTAEVKTPRSNTRGGAPRAPRRERSARAGAGPVPSRARKGTVMRPQSATEVSQIAKAQGRMMMMPRPPPPRLDAAAEKTACVARALYGLDVACVSCKPPLAAEQILHRSNSDLYFPHHAHNPNAGADCGVTFARLPPSLFSEGGARAAPGSGHPESQRRRGMACGEKGLCLDCTPTDEEISQLWNGVRTALTTKDAKTNLRKQAPESGRLLRKPGIQPPGSAGRRLLQTSQPTKQNAQLARALPNPSNAAFQKEGLESAAQFHLAEARADGPLEQRDAAAAMETAQTPRPGQQLGLTTISMEEQKILLSLERLNHQLHCVQEYVGGNSTTHGAVLIDPSYTGEIKVNLYRRSASSANSRPRHPKKL